MLSQATTVEHNLAQWSRGVAGLVTLGMGPLLASTFLPRLLVELSRLHPELVIATDVRAARDLVAGLEAEKIEFCLCSEVTAPEENHLDMEPVGSFRAGLFVRRAHPLAQVPMITGADLADFPVAAGENFTVIKGQNVLSRRPPAWCATITS